MTEKAAKRKMGWAMTMFCEGRFDIVRRHLSPEAQAKWDNISYAEKCLVVQAFVKKGIMI